MRILILIIILLIPICFCYNIETFNIGGSNMYDSLIPNLNEINESIIYTDNPTVTPPPDIYAKNLNIYINEVLKHNEGIIEKVMLEEEKKLKKASEGAADISARSTVPVQNSGGSNKEGE